MRLGLSVASRSGLPAARFAELAAAAEGAGFDAFLVAERLADSFALSHAALAATSTITVGTAVANARLRHPVLTGMTAATVDELYGGRFLLGLGVSNPALNEAPRPATGRAGAVHARLRRGAAPGCSPPTRRWTERPRPTCGVPRRAPAKNVGLAGEIADGVVST